MSTADFESARAEAIRDRAARRSFHRGILIGGTAAAVIAVTCAVLYPTFSSWLAGQTVGDSEVDDQGTGQPSRQDALAEGNRQAAEEKAPNQLAGYSTAKGSAPDDSELSQPEDGNDQLSQLLQEFAAFRQDVSSRLANVEASLDQPAGSGEQGTDLAALRQQLLARLDEIDAKVTQYDQLAKDFTAFYSSELPELRKSVNEFPKTDMRQDRSVLKTGTETTASQNDDVGLLTLNNTTGVAGYVYVNDEPVWLKLGRNEIDAPRGEIVVRIPNGGETYRLDAGLWQRDSTGRYTMNRPSWPPTAP